MGGLEVEGIERVGGTEGVVAGRIVDVAPHDRADRLRVCRLDVGNEQLQVVSGAPGLAAGQVVAVALPGAELAGGRRVEAVELRGVRSEAVLVSEAEMGLSEEGSRVRDLPARTTPGTNVSSILETADVVLDLAITPNRGDCLSVVGLAREVAALTGTRLRRRPLRRLRRFDPQAPAVTVEIHAPDRCPRYVACVVRGVRIGPSPLWLRRRLEACGVRPINNVVDVTNYVMLERGHPLHAFDLRRVAGPAIVVRRAGEDRTFVTLDEIERSLDPEDLLIADRKGPLALAGIMGGLGSAVQRETRDVLLEAAFFEPRGIRRTARRLGLRTESSYRFERQVDVEGVPGASERAAELLVRLARGEASPDPVDAYPNPPRPVEIPLRNGRVNQLLGTQLRPAEIRRALRRVVPEVRSGGRGVLRCRVPTWRSDLEREIDLIEEVARLVGYDRIEASLPRVALTPPGERTGGDAVRRARRLLVAESMNEMVAFRFCSDEWNRSIPASDGSARSVGIRNPLSVTSKEMRQSLLPGLLTALAHNRNQGETWFRAFEIGPVFQRDDRGEVLQSRRVGGVLQGNVPPRGLLKEGRRESFHDAKGVVEALLDGFRITPVGWRKPARADFLHPGKSARVVHGEDVLGFVGGLHPETAQAADVPGDTWVFELDFRKLAHYGSRRVAFRPLTRFPAVTRDLAIVADESFEAGDVVATVSENPEMLVDEVRLFDVYRGEPIPEGKKSLAYSIAYRAADRTLTDEEVSRLHEQLVRTLRDRLGVTPRE